MIKKNQFTKMTGIMLCKKICLLAILSLLITPLSFGQSVPQKPEPTILQNQIILKLKPAHKFNISTNKKTLGLQAIDQIAKKQGTYTVRQIGLSTPKTTFKKNRPNFENIAVLKYDSNINIEKAIKAFEALDVVEYAESNGMMYGSSKVIEDRMAELGYEAPQITPNDQYYSAQWWSENNGTYHNNYQVPPYFPTCEVDADIDLEAAWDITTGCSSVVIALLDTGMKLDHPEMAGRIIGGKDFVNNDDDASDDNGHGSNVGGIAFANGNEGGIHAGVNWSSDVLIVKVLNENNLGEWTDLADGIIWAVDNGATIMNASIGGQNAPQVLEDAVQYAYDNNVAIIVSSGNDNGNIAEYPAAYPQTISVGATTCDDSRVDNATWGSNYHSTLDLVAPGSSIYGLKYDSDEWGYWWGGTSQATPMVTGVASLMLCQDPNLSVEDIRTILRNTADDQVGDPNEDTPGYDIYHGAGRLNANEALLAVLDDNCTADAGTLTATSDINPVLVGGTTTLTASTDGNQVIPQNYELIYVLTKGNGLVIEQANSTPSFSVDALGDYTIHSLVYDPSTLDLGIIVFGQTTGFDVNSLLIQGSGDICASLLVNGPQFDVDSTCTVGTPCNDNDACTTGEIYDTNCNCIGGIVQDADNDGVCDADDVCPNGDDTVDLDNNSIPDDCDNDTEGCTVSTTCGDYDFDDCSADISVQSQTQDSITTVTIYIGGVLVLEDTCVVDDNGGGCFAGIPCDDNDDCTVFDKLDADCNCLGTFLDIDNDGVCDADDVCPFGDDNVDANNDGIPDDCEEETCVFGMPCDDGDDCTLYDFFDVNCNCAGFFIDYDNDGVCNAEDVCPSGDDTVDSDNDGIPDDCEETECIFGTPCDDGDDCTLYDFYDANCNCVGKYIDIDNDGVCDAEDDCPYDPTNNCQNSSGYCESSGYNTNYEYIKRVAFADIDNTSGNNDGYANYTNQIATVGTGDIVSIGLTPGFSGNSYNEAWTVWIDFDGDGHYSNSEKVFSDKSAGSLSGNFTIPSDAKLGLTRMRISMKWGRAAHPCGHFIHGEVEDYTVDIINSPQNYPVINLRNEDNLLSNLAIRMYPNPTADFLNVNLQNAHDNGTIRIVTMSGQTTSIQNIDAETRDLKIDVNHLPAGVYLIHLDFGGSTYTTERFVKLSH